MTQTKETTSIHEDNAQAARPFPEPPHHIPFAHKYELEQLVKKMKETMEYKSVEGNEMEELIMIDAIQRLGLECYFRDEIFATLEKWSQMGDDSDVLHDVALRFRLLRQAGYDVTAENFGKFKDKDGRYKQELSKDVKGLMSLYEASELRINGDQILDEAADFARNMLMGILRTANKSESVVIRNTLKNPYHKSLPRLTAKNQLHNFEGHVNGLHECLGRPVWVKEMQDLARIDHSLAQIQLQNEICQVSRWWKEVGMGKILEHARNQPIKWHMWSWVALTGPDMADLRTELTKPISFIYVIDDIFDVYGKPDQLALFTDAVKRWEYQNIIGLPDYMKVCLKTLYDTTDEMSHKIFIRHGWNPKQCFQNAWAELCDAFLVEGKWFAKGHLPTTEEYLKNGIVSSGVYVVYVTLFSLLGEAINDHKNMHLLSKSHPQIVHFTGTLLRLWDDLGSAKDEDQEGHDGSFVACYRNEHHGSSDENARECVFKMISNAWKSLNEECLSNSPFSQDFKTAFLNLARMIPIMYNYDDNHRLPNLEKHMKSLLPHE
ncbi:(3S,6E)-nerolidol synthase 1-like [Amaranthus tricolor]|uniref:(3S,6E)-nerolidol synthase 1-like n=1 Tax=Amaranthus tricolor TaxID=29722 RepID=UPI002590B172|nr:(3S,6E)-nerolidol synthase 1-like [Amaranthus tricolor]